jgi:hypothetical protein
MTGLETRYRSRKGSPTKNFHKDVVVDDLDANVSIQAGGNETTYRKFLASGKHERGV